MNCILHATNVVLKLISLCGQKLIYIYILRSSITTESHSLAVCGSLCGEKHFLLIFICQSVRKTGRSFCVLTKRKNLSTSKMFVDVL